MPRIAFRLWLRPDPEGIETYVRWHLEPFDGLCALIRMAGIQRNTIWLDGTDLLLTRGGEHPERGETLDLENPVHKAWADTMRPLFRDRVAREGAGRPDLVFSPDPDAAPGPVSGQIAYRAGLADGLPDGQAASEAVAARWRAGAAAVGEAMRAAGVRRAWTWVEDGSAWTYLECDALDATEAALAADPGWATFWSGLAGSLDERTGREGWRRTREVFRYD